MMIQKLTRDDSKTMIEWDLSKYSEKIIDTMAEALIVISPEGTILTVNRSFEVMFGYTSSEIVGQSCKVLECDVCELMDHEKQGCWCRLFKYKEDVRKRCKMKKKDGTYVSLLKNASLMKDDDGNALGAVEILTDISELDKLDQKVELLSRKLADEGEFHGIVGKSRKMQKIFELIKKAAESDAPIIIYGESGTGKELVAQAIHKLGTRKDKPFVQLNCAALNESLLESELFGHVKGAFTGAYRHRIGRFEVASGGDVFLDEIGDVPLSTQVKLLRVLELNEIERVGDHQPIAVDFRLISATNKNLQELIDAKLFRSDFFFRINVIPIHLPPLRERREDIPILVNSFISRLRERSGKKISGVNNQAMELFMSYDWPGNIRELKSVLEYAFVVTEKGLIALEHLPPLQQESGPVPSKPEFNSLNEGVPQIKLDLIDALKKTNGNQSRAAKILGINRVTVWNRMKKFGIDIDKIVQI